MIKMKSLRFTMSPFTPEEMLEVGNTLLSSIKTRIQSGLDVNEQSAKPLKGTTKGSYIPYSQEKSRRGAKPIRDLTFSGQLMNSLQVLSVNQESGKIGSNNPVKSRILGIQNRRCPQFGISPADLKAMNTKALEILKGKIKTETTE